MYVSATAVLKLLVEALEVFCEARRRLQALDRSLLHSIVYSHCNHSVLRYAIRRTSIVLRKALRATSLTTVLRTDLQRGSATAHA